MKLLPMLKGLIIGAAGGAIGYVIGGVASPYVAGVSAEVYAAAGFLILFALSLAEEVK